MRESKDRATESRPRVLVVGGGVAALEFVLALAELAPGRAQVELVAPTNQFSYRPFAVAETFGLGKTYRLPLARFAEHHGAGFQQDRVVGVDLAEHVVRTAAGKQLPFDLLVIAAGTQAAQPFPGALMFRGEHDEQAFRRLLLELDAGDVSSIAFALPLGPSWPLPVYELALLTAAQLAYRRRSGRLALVTPEPRPLERFGAAASRAVGELLAAADIELYCGCYPREFVSHQLKLVPEGSLTVDRVVTLPRLHGPQLSGLPHNADGFVPTNAHGLVPGTGDVYAAGDATVFPLKHGGIAIQQADAVAEAIAARLGARIDPAPLRPVLRGLLLTGTAPRFLWADLVGGQGDTSATAAYPLWWPPAKIAGGWLTRYLHAEGLPLPPPPTAPGAVPVEVDLAPATDTG